MSHDNQEHCQQAYSDWWSTSVSNIQPDIIELRGYAIQDLIEHASLADTIWLMLRGDRPTPAQSRLLEAALVSSVDHGPQAPSIATARMAATTGIGINNAVASGVNLLGDIHGGAGQECVQLFEKIRAKATDNSSDLKTVVSDELATLKAEGRHVPGFGHRFHSYDPRRDPLVGLTKRHVNAGEIDGWALEIGLLIEASLTRADGRKIPMNIDGATAIIYAELGFPPELVRGLFVLSRSIGIVAHAYEEFESGKRIKGPIPRNLLPSYKGPARRPF